MATVNNDVFANHTPITLGVLRNGVPGQITRTVRESAIAKKYHFRGIIHTTALEGNPASFIPPCPTTVILEAQIRSAYAQIIHASVEASRLAHNATAGAGAFDEAAAVDSIAGLATAKLEAIALGSVHTALVRSYALGQADLRSTESNTPYFSVNAPAAYANGAAFMAALTTPTAGWTVQVADDDYASTRAVSMPALSADEVELAFAMTVMGQASPVRAGIQLFEDGHHYHSSGNKRHSAIEAEVLGKVSSSTKALWMANLMMLRNCVWHAAIHPVNIDVLESFACDPDMPERLDQTGYGTLSIGLPAHEGPFKRALTYITLWTKVQSAATAHGHNVSLDDLRTTYNALVNLGRGGPFPTNRPELPGIPAGPFPVGCDSRPKMVKMYLEPALATAEPVVAWMFGFYSEICERANIRQATNEGSLLRSWSLRAAMGNYIGEANSGREMVAARARMIRAQGNEGLMETYVGHA